MTETKGVPELVAHDQAEVVLVVKAIHTDLTTDRNDLSVLQPNRLTVEP
jgi:hypothetical protein